MIQSVFSVRYLLLRKESKRLLLWRDALPTVLVIATFSLVIYLVPELNFFGPNGVVDRIGSLTSTLTGFYVAALVAAATFASSHAELDEEIKNGRIFQVLEIEGEKYDDYLTRREYVCAIFGYVSIVALLISISSILVVSVSGSISIDVSTWSWSAWLVGAASNLAAISYMVVVFHLILSTAHGLYYLSYRLYIGEGAPVNTPWGETEEMVPEARNDERVG